MLRETIRTRINEKLGNERTNISAAERMAGLPENAIRNILDGVSKNPKIETIQAIAKFLDCSLDELVGNITKAQAHTYTVLNLDTSLLKSVTNFIIDYVVQNKLDIAFDKIMFFIKQSYEFCYEKRNKSLDQEFIEWLIEANSK